MTDGKHSDGSSGQPSSAERSSATENVDLQKEAMSTLPKAPAAVRAVLAASADPGVVGLFDKALDLAYSESLATGDMDRLRASVLHWWRQAVLWSDPDKHRANLARWDRLLHEGPPSPERRMNRSQIRERYGI